MATPDHTAPEPLVQNSAIRTLDLAEAQREFSVARGLVVLMCARRMGHGTASNLEGRLIFQLWWIH